MSIPYDTLRPGEWYLCPSSHLASVLPNPIPPGDDGPAGIMEAWNGAALDTQRERLIVWGGGHADYAGNEVYAFDLNALTWARIWGPSAVIPAQDFPASTYETYADGNPAARHTYDSLVYIPSADKMMATNGALPWSGNGTNATWLFHFATGTWARVANTPDIAGYGPSSNVYDPVTGKVYYQGNVRFAEYTPATNTWIQRGTIGAGISGDPTAAIDPIRRLYVLVGLGHVRVWDLNTFTYSEHATTGPATIVNAEGPGFKYDPVRHTFIGWVGGATVYELNPDTWAWTALNPAATNTVTPTNKPSQGCFGRFQYVPSKNVYVAVNSIYEDVYIYKLSSGSGTTGSSLTSFSLTSSTTVASAPFTVGLAFRKGDLATAALDLTNQQIVVKRRWNDGSIKHAIASGQASLTASVPLTVHVSNGSPSAGAALTASDIAAAGPVASVQCGSIGTVHLSSLLATPFRTWISGPVMVEAHYRAPVGSDPTLAVWFYVRLYANGKMWVRAIVENGYLDVATSDKSYVPTIIIGGVIVYNHGGLALPHYAYTRYTAEGWIGGDPAITPRHDAAYLRSTKLVPNYWKTSPSETRLNGLIQTYTPMSRGGHEASMGTAGFQYGIGLLPLWDALYCTSTDPRAYKSSLANSSHVNSYPIVWRDSRTGLIPKPSDYPTYAINGGTYNKTAGALTWELNHHPSAGYLAYLISGDYWHYETLAFMSAINYLCLGDFTGTGVNRLLVAETRGTAWMIRTLAQHCAIVPDGDAVGIDYKSLLNTNINHWKAVRDSCVAAGRLLGYVYEYNVDIYALGTIAPWQQHFWIQSMGLGSDIEPLADMTDFNLVRDHMYRAAVGFAGDMTAWYYTWIGVYNAKISAGGNGNPTTWYSNWFDAWNASVAEYPNNGALPQGPATGNTLLLFPEDAETGYWGNYLPGLIYAVDHGAPGAAASLARLMAASNWSILENAGFDDVPIWGITPRSFNPPPPSNASEKLVMLRR